MVGGRAAGWWRMRRYERIPLKTEVVLRCGRVGVEAELCSYESEGQSLGAAFGIARSYFGFGLRSVVLGLVVTT